MILDTLLVSVVSFLLFIPEVLIISHIVWIRQPHEDPKLLTYVRKWSLHAEDLDPNKEVILLCFPKSPCLFILVVWSESQSLAKILFDLDK
jgi:hypothetical protein